MARGRVDRSGDLLAPRCAECGAILPEQTPGVNFGDMVFHAACGPNCATCGRPLGPNEGGWRAEGSVVSEPWGYSVRPSRFWCPECLGSAPRDEPRGAFWWGRQRRVGSIALSRAMLAPLPQSNWSHVLCDGSFEKIELIPWGSNYTFVAVLRGEDGESCLGVYKPRRGEAPLRDFPSGTLFKREVAAYRLAQEIGWDMVPLTIIREEGPYGIGSLQLFVEPCATEAAQYDHLRETHSTELQRMAVFDLLANNADRKGAHCLLDLHGHLWGIDHGLTFHPVSKLRTVIWDFCGEDIPPDLVATLADLRSDSARVDALRLTLDPLLSATEIDALLLRWDRLLETPCFPPLDPYRNVPWPPF